MTLFANHDRAPRDLLGVVHINSTGCKSAPTQTVGTVIGNGLVLTVAHGVAGQKSTSITTISGQVFEAKILAIDTELDLAVLYVTTDPASKLDIEPIKFAKAVAGSTVYFVAYQDSLQVIQPAKIKRTLSIKTQDIYLETRVTRPGIEVDAKVVVGNSGGPLINNNGEIVGIIWSTSRTFKNRSWATRIEAANELLSRVSATNPSTQSPQVVACVG